MNEERTSADSRGVSRSGRPFLQPLAVALVCVIFVSLLLILWLMNLKALDKALVGYMENRALSIAKDVQLVADRYFRRLVQMPLPFFDAETGSPLTEDDFSLQESWIIDFVQLALDIDSELETNHLNDEQLAALLTEEGLRLFACLDQDGNITFKNRPIPQEVLRLAAPVVRGSEEFKIDIFNPLAKEEGLGFMALRRRSGKGTMILGLDDEGFRYRSSRFSIQRAVEETVEDPDIVYLIVTDERGKTLGLSVDSFENRKEEHRMERSFRGTTGMITRKIVSGNREVIEFVAPVKVGDAYTGTIHLGLATDVADRILEKSRSGFLTSTGFMVAIAFLSMWLLYKNQNRYLGRIHEMQRRIHQAERLSSLGRLAARVAHEIRNPLNAVSMAVQRLQRDRPHKLTRVIRDEIERLNHIIEEFLSLSRSRDLELGRHDLTELLEQIVLLMKEEVKSKGITFKTRWDDSPLMVSMDRERMKQAFLNIINNAVDSISSEGSITLSAKPIGKDRIVIRISDTGIGLGSEEIEHIFELDYTTKDKGLGLGLPLAHEIIRGHGGEIRVASQPGSGTTFEILLPSDKR